MSCEEGCEVWGELEGDFPEACARVSPLPTSVEEDDEFIDELAPLDISYSSPRPASPAECPCCKASLASGELSDCHKHVTQCFSQRHAQQQQQNQEDDHRRLAMTQQRIERIRGNLAKMMLHQRISLLESFGRLAHAAKHNIDIESGSTLSSKSRAGDQFVLNLLFKPCSVLKRPNFAVDTLRVHSKGSLHNIPPATAENISYVPSPSSAFSTSAKPFVAPDESPLVDRLSNSSTPDAPVTNGRFRQTKRHRDVAQALHFSPQQPYFDGPQTKQQKLQI